MENIKVQKKRGRRPLGSITSLEEITKCQPQEQLTNYGYHVTDLPWQNNSNNNSNNNVIPTISNTNKSGKSNINYTDDEIDNLDLFPNDTTIEYEKIYKTQPNQSNIRMAHLSTNSRDLDVNDIYKPQTINQYAQEANVLPEHLRIINLQNLIDESSITMAPSPSTPTTADVIIDNNNNNNNKEEMYFHPFRLEYYRNEEENQQLLYRIEDNISWPDKSQFACWWDGHTFDDYPKVIPISIQGNTIKVVGNFCSWQCAKSYVLKNLKSLYPLFHLFYSKLFKESSETIIPASNPLCLKLYGGSMTIEEYRISFYNSKRRVSIEVLSNLNIFVSKMFVFDSKYIQNHQTLNEDFSKLNSVNGILKKFKIR